MIIQSNISMRTSDMANHHTSSRRRPFLILVEILTQHDISGISWWFNKRLLWQQTSKPEILRNRHCWKQCQLCYGIAVSWAINYSNNKSSLAASVSVSATSMVHNNSQINLLQYCRVFQQTSPHGVTTYAVSLSTHCIQYRVICHTIFNYAMYIFCMEFGRW